METPFGCTDQVSADRSTGPATVSSAQDREACRIVAARKNKAARIPLLILMFPCADGLDGAGLTTIQEPRMRARMEGISANSKSMTR